MTVNYPVASRLWLFAPPYGPPLLMNLFYEQHDRLMTYAQTITGFFDHVAEAQQAVQRLLAHGFATDRIQFSAQLGGNPWHRPTDTGTTGRFLVALFGRNKADLTADEAAKQEASTWQRTDIQVSIQIQSAHEADLAVEAFSEASSVHFGTHF